MQELCRLRSGNRIRGYRRTEEGTHFYSRDFFWWTGIEIQFDDIDLFCGIKDKNNRALFAWDVITFKRKGILPAQHYVVALNCDGQFELRKKGRTPGLPMEFLKDKTGIALVGHHFPVAEKQTS
jgi:hypothetical protein